MCCRSMTLKFFIFPELFQLTKIILFEDGRHDLNRKEKLLSFILPLVCSIKSTAKNNGVEMRMIIHPGAPGMKYADISNPCSKMLRIRRQLSNVAKSLIPAITLAPEHIGHFSPLERALTLVCHSCPQVPFHHTFLFEPKVISSGVSGKFFSDHSVISSGCTSAKLLFIAKPQPPCA